MAEIPYNKKNMEDASSYFKKSQGQQDLEDAVSSGWNKIKGLVGAGEDDTPMGKALEKRKKKLVD